MELTPCPNCKSKARIRHNEPYTWIECKKKCGMKTGFYHDSDADALYKATKEWNSLKEGKNG